MYVYVYVYVYMYVYMYICLQVVGEHQALLHQHLLLGLRHGLWAEYVILCLMY